jgi:hypothetical protein
MRVLMSVLGAVLLTGCYTYRPLATTSPEPGVSVRAQLTDDGSIDLARYIGPNVAAVGGRVVGSDTGQLTLSVASVQYRTGIEQYWSGEMVRLPRTEIATMQEKRLSTTRTALFAGGLLAGVVGLFVTLSEGSAEGQSGRGPPPPPD